MAWLRWGANFGAIDADRSCDSGGGSDMILSSWRAAVMGRDDTMVDAAC